MPIYDFLCADCQKSFEEIATTESTPPCPYCGSTHVNRGISAPSPLKTGAFPFKVGPVHPMVKQKSTGSCPAAGGCSGGSGGFS